MGVFVTLVFSHLSLSHLLHVNTASINELTLGPQVDTSQVPWELCPLSSGAEESSDGSKRASQVPAFLDPFLKEKSPDQGSAWHCPHAHWVTLDKAPPPSPGLRFPLGR